MMFYYTLVEAKWRLIFWAAWEGIDIMIILQLFQFLRLKNNLVFWRCVILLLEMLLRGNIVLKAASHDEVHLHVT